MIPELENEGESVVEEQKPFGSAGRRQEHLKISRRDTLVNDLKNSTGEGLAAFGLSVVALLTVLSSVLVSYYRQGEAGMFLGLMPVIALVLAVLALIFSGLGFRRKDKVRHYMEKRALVIALITLTLLIALYVRGAILYFGQQ